MIESKKTVRVQNAKGLQNDTTRLTIDAQKFRFNALVEYVYQSLLLDNVNDRIDGKKVDDKKVDDKDNKVSSDVDIDGKVEVGSYNIFDRYAVISNIMNLLVDKRQINIEANRINSNFDREDFELKLKLEQVLSQEILKNQELKAKVSANKAKSINLLHQIYAKIIGILFSIMKDETVYEVYQNSIVYKVLYDGFQEIFIYGKYCRGFHVKCSKYARGGVRISRRIDYLHEVRQLAFSQHEKNVSIVPGGSKAGFKVINDNDFEWREIYESLEEKDIFVLRKKAYQEFVEVLLYIDNYIFIAPDVGTAEFSDLANQIAMEKEHWAGNAFATGGIINGISHKLTGITSKGGYEVLKTHGIDMYPGDNFTAIGIGGMAGDVFGNFMILTKNINLLAAFDHQHIFIDPRPNVLESYEERLRLKKMEGATWKDYSKLSSGGMVYDRSEKEVKLTHSIRNLIGYDSEVISTDLLIKKILQMSVDVMISGGVGTYIISEGENVDIVNRELQCKPDEINVRFIIEMANLSITKNALKQLKARTLSSRIESSAGVTCSDYEVNIKLVSPEIIVNKHVKFIEKMTLLHMYHKSMTINAYYKDSSIIDEYGRLLNALHDEVANGIVNVQNLNQVLLGYFPKELHAVYYEDILQHKFANEITVTCLSNLIMYIVGLDNLEKLLNRVSILLICNYIVEHYEAYQHYFHQKVLDIGIYREEQYKNYLIFLSIASDME